jgi:hypothetical protein
MEYEEAIMDPYNMAMYHITSQGEVRLAFRNTLTPNDSPNHV